MTEYIFKPYYIKHRCNSEHADPHWQHIIDSTFQIFFSIYLTLMMHAHFISICELHAQIRASKGCRADGQVPITNVSLELVNHLSCHCNDNLLVSHNALMLTNSDALTTE